VAKIKDQETVKVIGWNYNSAMDPKKQLGKDYNPDLDYRYVRQDNVDLMKDTEGYESDPSNKRFKELVLMRRSRERLNQSLSENRQRQQDVRRALDDNLRREVERSGQGGVVFTNDEKK
jgi:hypothetical protein